MKKRGMIGAAGLALMLSVAALGQDVGKFRYRPERIVPGTVYHYVKTNLDGSNPEHISIYVAAPDRIESYKFHPGNEPAALVTADMDWASFSVRRLVSNQVFRGESKLLATLDFDAATRTLDVSIPVMRPGSEQLKIRHLPVHIYNFDLASLNFAFRHLINPTASFTIGIADPSFKDEGPLMVYKGEARVRYASEQMRNGAFCRRYRIDGRGLENRGGWFWVNKRLGHIEDIEIALPDNPAWQSFKFKLEKIEHMSRPEWESFMKSRIAAP